MALTADATAHLRRRPPDARGRAGGASRRPGPRCRRESPVRRKAGPDALLLVVSARTQGQRSDQTGARGTGTLDPINPPSTP